MHIRKITVSIAILLISVILLSSVTYAWLSLSKVPEVTGIVTHIGSNGSLEIALLSSETYVNPFLIRTAVGDSAALIDITKANLSWGNIIDLLDPSYGLDKISILPSRLNVRTGIEGSGFVGDNILVFPEYGIDGRLQSVHSNTVSAIYSEDGFIYSTTQQKYGVRGIGTVKNITLQQSALVNARAALKSCISSSHATIESMWNTDGGNLLNMYISHYVNGDNSFDSSDIATIKDAANKILGAINYVDIALRQSVIGYAASAISDAADFKAIREMVENTMFPLSAIVSASPVQLPSAITSHISIVENEKLELQKIIVACNKYVGNSFTWDQIYPILSELIKPNEIYLADTKLSNLSPSSIIRVDNRVTLSTKAGALAVVADFSGNYDFMFQYTDKINFEAVTTSKVSPSYLVESSNLLEKLEAADTGGEIDSVALDDVYGYAIDMAFRCNEESNLLLQTFPEDRVADETGEASNQGSGSFMKFSSEQLDTESIIKMMDAIRVAFIDNRGNLLSIAKLSLSSYVKEDDGVYAPLYLYDYTISQEGIISMGERRDALSPIVALPESIPTVITVIVWLDGDHVDNNLSAIAAQSMTGSFNLQFSSTANLNPADITLQPKG